MQQSSSDIESWRLCFYSNIHNRYYKTSIIISAESHRASTRLFVWFRSRRRTFYCWCCCFGFLWFINADVIILYKGKKMGKLTKKSPHRSFDPGFNIGNKMMYIYRDVLTVRQCCIELNLLDVIFLFILLANQSYSQFLLIKSSHL